MKKKIFEMFDYVLILAVLLLVALGVMFIYSSGINSDGVMVSNEYIKQIIWASIGFVLMTIFTIYDYRKMEPATVYLFGFFILTLLYTIFFGRYVNGAKSWVGIGDIGIQPAELGKMFYILFFAHFLAKSVNINPLKRFLFACLILIIPVGLILMQPDLGTASVYLPIFLIMCFIADIPVKYLLYVILLGLFTIGFTILPIWNSEIAKNPIAVIFILTNFKLRAILIFTTIVLAVIGFIVKRYFHSPRYISVISHILTIVALSLIFSFVLGKVLKDYQIKRLIIFMNPYIDPKGAGWNVIQSEVAIGSGGMSGQGFLKGTQSHFSFLPQQSTDFIFSILSEESGFIGGCLVFVLYFFILIKILYIIHKCSNKFGMYICAGIFAMFLYHFIVNVGMVMGIVPITGIPLLFLSYGGSSLLTAMSSIGLIMNVNFRKSDLDNF